MAFKIEPQRYREGGSVELGKYGDHVSDIVIN